MTILTKHFYRAFTIALLPLSMIPFGLFLVTHHRPGYGVRSHGGTTPWPAPTVMLTADDMKFEAPPAYTRGIPVLLLHGINYDTNPKTDTYSVTPQAFARDCAFLKRLGYHTISIYQYLAWHQHTKVNLPSKPILITFDDARFDTYRGADRILAKYHMQATIFVIVGQTEKRTQFYLYWQELRKMQNSGRWDVQFHAYFGHVMVPINARGKRGPFYAAREYWPAIYDKHGVLIRKAYFETMAQFVARVKNDISTGLRIMAAHGWHSQSMAMPFGEYGQGDTTDTVDTATAPYLAAILQTYVKVIFVQSGHAYTPYSRAVSDTGAERKELRHTSTIYDLYHFLDHSNPTAIRLLKHNCKGVFELTVYQGATCQHKPSKG